MNREVIFRGKIKNGKWVEGYLIKSESNINNGRYYILSDFHSFESINDYKSTIGYFLEIIPETVSQYIGRKDGNQVKIFEGDKVSFNGNITADDSFGLEPNGWVYDENLIYTVIWNNELAGWDLDFEEDASNKFKYHTRSLLLDGNCEIVK